jgi:mannan endo-1,4-beta-mannosidase
LTRAKLLKERKAAWKQEREKRKVQGEARDGVRIRGRWVSTPAKRQSELEAGPAFDGSAGVDSEDIINIPDIGFGSFQLFPDQYNYGRADPTLPKFNQTLQVGLDWIRRHAEAGQL